MPKVLTIIAMVIAGLVLLIFALDAAIGVPFKKASLLMDVGFIICALALGYLSWTTYREQT
jgi:uncharacterized membrane protein YwaF